MSANTRDAMKESIISCSNQAGKVISILFLAVVISLFNPLIVLVLVLSVVVSVFVLKRFLCSGTPETGTEQGYALFEWPLHRFLMLCSNLAT